MIKYLAQCIFAFTMLVSVSCSKENVLNELEQIKIIGDKNPQKALIMLDSLEIDMRESSDYIRSKYDLLRIRLNDKADNMPNSDIIIKRLIEYFEKKGSLSEKQEVYYYAGSIYRDLQDTPQALEYFLKSLDYTSSNRNYDTIMLRNTYSNLNYLYYRVQNYNDAVNMAKKELAICKLLKTDSVLPYLHIDHLILL